MTETVTLYEDELQAIEDGEAIEKGGNRFYHTDSKHSDGYAFMGDSMQRIRDGEILYWGDVKGKYGGERTVNNDSPVGVLEELEDVFEEKNDDYGNSWEKVGVLKRVMADEKGPRLVTLHADGTWSFDREDEREKFEAVVLADTPQKQSTFEENADDVITRLLDKLVRSYNLLFLKDEPDVENESTEDAAKDLTGYSSMLTSLIRGEK